MRDALEKIARGLALSIDEAYDAAKNMLTNTDEALSAAILMGLRVRGEASSEIAGFARALRDYCVKIPVSERNRYVDTAGTGGDGFGTLNASTAAALIAAYLGAHVIKHGNRSVSSTSGSADFLETLGFNINLPPDKAAEMVNRHRFTFAFAPAYHPAMRNIMSVRKKLGIRTIFNLVGPLANPALLTRQLIGVAETTLMDRMAEAATMLGYEHAVLIHGEPGIDEVSVFGKTTVVEIKGGRIDKYFIEPRDLGLRTHDIGDVRVSSPLESVEKTRRAISGKDRAARDFINANTAFTLYIAGIVKDVRDGIEYVEANLNDGFWDYVNELARVSRS
ncbi:anthranilate phosphoribosyltransferase [Vulcanisaeta souniana]|uniref:Anthranilate phosphoribosyltransferase n=1 Tax=Vulcanisaeta souniana JCM 11219 TaxID=1293586 RepID=A0A830E264_9CREN|nr:anthranilate phosphoribosyltransferase [Vulcanisaeta souniana]BDR92355.1 anthranilate phosphoribosyltransferase [Vulcanisaeta souniana JCM 11219]GGI74930.1 anthranilate phosphoribosyltransferase [Vulcanisaeta souniana JCM 11219]